MTDDTTTTWLLRLQALTVAERPALLREMSWSDVCDVVEKLLFQVGFHKTLNENTTAKLELARERVTELGEALMDLHSCGHVSCTERGPACRSCAWCRAYVVLTRERKPEPAVDPDLFTRVSAALEDESR